VSGWEPKLPARWADPARPAFVGRRPELAVLEQVWTATEAGLRQVVFVGAEPGGGKSRLLAEAATALHRAGAAVLLGTCAAEFGAPYQPFVEPIEALLARAPVPEPAAARLRTLAGRSAAPDRNDRRELFDAVVDAVRAAAADAPLVLALEDVHWAGPAALQLLSHLVERTAECRLLVLATHRTTAPDRSAPLATAIAQLYRLDGVRRVDLAGLDTEDIAEYLQREGGLPPRRARTAAAVLRDQTGGNPFFLREVWRDPATRPSPGGQLRAPVSVRDTVESRLARLSADQRRTVELAAVVGEDVDLTVLLAAAQVPRDVTLSAVDEAVAHGLLEAPVESGTTVRWTHALARQAVLELLPASRRALEHVCVAEILEARTPPSDARTQQLAHHWSQAAALGHTEQAVRYLTAAAQAADRSLAHEDAGAAFEQAAQLAADPDERARLLLSAARSHLRGGDFGRSRTLAEQLAGSAAPRERLEAAILYEDAAWRPGLPGGRAVDLLAEALQGASDDPADPLRVRALASLGRALAFTGATEAAGRVGAYAIDLARAAADDDLLAHALQASLWNGLRPEHAPLKLTRAAELSMLGHLLGEPRYLAQSAYFRGAIAYMRGDPEELAVAEEDLLNAGRVGGEDFYDYVAGCLRYARQFAEGDLVAAQRTCEELREFGETFGGDDTDGSSAVQTFMIRREAGTVGQVRPLITGEERPQDLWAPGLLALYTELGLDRPAARVLHWLLDGRLTGYRESAQWPAVLAFAAEAALRLGDEPAARQLRPLLDEYAGLNLVAGQFVAVFGAADRYRGAMDSLLGLPTAEDRFADALAMDERMGSPLYRAHSLAALVRHRRGTGAGVAELVAQARGIAEPLGLRRVLALLDPEPVLRPNGAAGLTARETEVLRLLAEGMANREIAERLVISENTAANHVRSILAKTGSGNRTQAAMFAAAHRLLG